MSKAQRRFCVDVQVMRGAVCNTDHKMLRVKLRLGRKTCRRIFTGVRERMFVLQLQERCVDEEERNH